MNLNEYSTKAIAFASFQPTKELDMIHGALGITSDMGELVECLSNHYVGNSPMDVTNLQEESGDIAWFVNLTACNMGETLASIYIAAVERTGNQRKHATAELTAWMVISCCRIADMVKASMVYGKPLNTAEMRREMGDILVLIEDICRPWGITLEDVLEGNIAKLTARYGAKFDQAKALNRDKQAERDAIDKVAA